MKTIIMDFSLSQVKTALLDGGKLIEVLVDNYENASVVGNIYAGRIDRIVPQQFAFIDAGLNKNCFLSLDNVSFKGFSEGSHITVQIMKDETAQKGPCAGLELSLAGRFVILTYQKGQRKSVGVSQKIDGEAVRAALRESVSSILPEGFGAIIRTKAADVPFCDIESELLSLHEKLSDIAVKSEYVKAPALLYAQSNLESSLKLLLDESVSEIILNEAERAGEVSQVVERYLGTRPKISVYDGDVDIFDYYGVDGQLERALGERVWLKSGGFLLFEQTKTLNVIDVNTGKLISKNKRKAVTNVNLEAAVEIARQIRLRNLSGMILIDFINMDEREDRAELIRVLETELKKDRIVATIADYGPLGIVQLTRKKTRGPLSAQLMESCPHCGGLGLVSRVDLIGDNIYKKVKKILAQTVFDKITVRAHPSVIQYLNGTPELALLQNKRHASIILTESKSKSIAFFEIDKKKAQAP